MEKTDPMSAACGAFSRPCSMLWPTALLGAGLVTAKAGAPGAISRAHEFWAIAAADAMYALVLGLGAWSILIALRNWPRTRRAIRGLLLAFFAANLVYGVVSVLALGYLNTWLDAPLIEAGADFKAMRSSLIAFVRPGWIAMLAGATLAYGLLVWLAGRRLGAMEEGRAGRRAAIVGIGLIAAWFAGAKAHLSGGLSIDTSRLSQNPHAVLIESLLRRSAVPHLGTDYAPDYAADFHIVSERTRPPVPTPGLARGPRNVIVVVCESVGTQFLSLYGSPYKTWPRMETESAHALVFDEYYAHFTNSANSLFTLLLSNYPALRGEEFIRKHPAWPGTTAAQVLARQGYRTAFITAAFNEWARADLFLADRGFDTIWDCNNTGEPPLNSWGSEDRAMVDMVLRYIDGTSGQPFFVFSWTQATHHPYGPEYGQAARHWDNPDLLRGETKFGDMTWDLGRYLSAMVELDKQLGRLLDGLRKRNLADDTIVIITGDHGEVFGWPHKAYGHGGGVYEEYLHVPLLIWNPRLFKSPPRNKTLGGHVDLQATVLDLLGLAPQATWQGRSLFAADRANRVYLFGSADQGYLGVREGNMKYVYNRLIQSGWLYDLAKDPHEQVNAAEEHPELCARLRQRLAAWAHYQHSR